jgi:hypothetical protein
MYLVLTSDTLTPLEAFVEGIKSTIDITIIVHYSLVPYAEWMMIYLATTVLCPPDLVHHHCYTAMHVNYNAFGQVLHCHLHSESIIMHSHSADVYLWRPYETGHPL